MTEMPRFVALETQSSTKRNWAVWMRDPDSNKYSILIARVYDPIWADVIVGLLNDAPQEAIT